uniref:taste receptor type 2 member 14-like n=1 Tax=Jaculus jaculus TaxID=51337 RepID=UPI00064D36AB|nr:taste receptor type 2 member 14-like [Jaculus jaculus]
MGSLGNGFIVLVNCMDWVKRRKLSSADKILTALAVSRIAMLCLVLISLLVTMLHPGLLTSKMVRVTDVIWTVTNHFNLWLTTSLSIFYFLKIATFSNSIFLYLKWRVKRVTSVTLLVSLLILFLDILITHKYHNIRDGGSKGTKPTGSSSRNSTESSKALLVTHSVFMLVPFTVSMMAFLLLIFSLWRHLKQMQITMTGPRDASTTAHVKALLTGIALLFLHAIFSVSLVIEISSFDLLEESLIILIEHATGIAFPSSHSFVLILGNSKLRRASLSVLWQLTCWSKDREPSAH